MKKENIMKKKLFTLTFALLIPIFFSNAESLQSNSTVYICTGPKAVVYHKTPKCSGLNRCSGDIVKTTIEKAKKTRRACKICYR